MPEITENNEALIIRVKERGPQGIPGNDGEDGSSGGAPSVPTLPLTPNDGDMVWHVPTGRKILYKYSATTTEWEPILIDDTTAGSTTVYVDGDLGTDSLEKGFGTGADACKKITYVLEKILPAFSSKENICYIRVAGTVDEDSFTFANNHGLRLQIIGETTDIITGQSSTALGVGTITKAGAGWTPDEFKGKFLNTGSVASSISFYLPILGNTEDTIFVNPAATTSYYSTFGVHDVATVLSSTNQSYTLYLSAGIATVSDLRFTSNRNFGYPLYVVAESVNITRCIFEQDHVTGRGFSIYGYETVSMNQSLCDMKAGTTSIAGFIQGGSKSITGTVFTRDAKGSFYNVSLGSGFAQSTQNHLYGGGYNVVAGCALTSTNDIYEECPVAVTSDRGCLDISLISETFTACDVGLVNKGSRDFSYAEASSQLVFAPGAPDDTLTLNVDECLNVLYATLTGNSAILLTGNEIQDKPITIWVTHSGGAWTLKWNGTDVLLEGLDGETESVLVEWNGANWIVNRGGVVDLVI